LDVDQGKTRRDNSEHDELYINAQDIEIRPGDFEIRILNVHPMTIKKTEYAWFFRPQKSFEMQTKVHRLITSHKLYLHLEHSLNNFLIYWSSITVNLLSGILPYYQISWHRHLCQLLTPYCKSWNVWFMPREVFAVFFDISAIYWYEKPVDRYPASGGSAQRGKTSAIPIPPENTVISLNIDGAFGSEVELREGAKLFPSDRLLEYFAKIGMDRENVEQRRKSKCRPWKVKAPRQFDGAKWQICISLKYPD
jgi:hypothetical protein